MKRITYLLIIGLLVLIGVPGRTLADVYTVTPKEAVVFAGDATHAAKVAFVFDLSGLRQGDNRHIELGLLDWRVAGLDAETPMTFSAHSITSAWTKASVEGGSAPAMAEALTSDWQVSPMASEKAEGKLIRLDLTDLVGAWASGESANYGVVVATSALGGEALSDQFAKVQLTIRYGFRDNW